MAVSEFDEYLIHQIPATLDHVVNDSPHFMDRMAFICHNADGSLYLFGGLGTFPNANVMDGFICIRHKNMQRNIRISRHLKNDRANTEVGALSFKVLEPLKRWGIQLGENDLKMGCSLEFNGRAAPFSQKPEVVGQGAQAHYNQMGTCRGTINLDGRSYEVNNYLSVRDRSWGTRGPGVQRIFDVYFWLHAQFKDFVVSLTYLDDLSGSHKVRQGGIIYDDGRVVYIEKMKHRVEFLPGSKIYTKITLVLEDAQGKEMCLTANPISPPAYLTGAGYDDRHGLDRGPYHAEGEEWEVNDVRSSDPLRFLWTHRIAEFQFEKEAGSGLIESSFGHPADWKYKPTL